MLSIKKIKQKVLLASLNKIDENFVLKFNKNSNVITFKI